MYPEYPTPPALTSRARRYQKNIEEWRGCNIQNMYLNYRKKNLYPSPLKTEKHLLD
jgi:hypothetical protein